ncbi:MAG: endonuclease/exonuclease/phosphatase [Bacteroidetes bacterium 4572_114]|nr:MAG: endonuclease/exonuclease/phosphatase [Bacteroidetes bacterium 4572_114]
MKNQYYIAWWNVENLFDVFNSTQRPAWLQSKLKSELKGWDTDVLNRKIRNLASIISQMNNNTGPDILGLCEVENLVTLEKLKSALQLLGRNYGIVHHDTNDLRGIDVAFIYDKDKFIFQGSFSHVILKRTATRDLFQANFLTPKNQDLILIGNHWTARSAGVLESEPYRIIAGETLSYWMERIVEIKGKDIAVLVMGDMNDEPFNRSVKDYALGTNSHNKVVYARSPRLFNLMWPFPGHGLGTYYYNNFPYVFDQLLVSKEMIKSTGKIKIAKGANHEYLTRIEMIPEMVSGGRYPNPIAHGRPSKKSSFNPAGFSDHYPVSVVVEE